MTIYCTGCITTLDEAPLKPMRVKGRTQIGEFEAPEFEVFYCADCVEIVRSNTADVVEVSPMCRWLELWGKSLQVAFRTPNNCQVWLDITKACRELAYP